MKIALLKKETAEQAIHFAHESIEMHGGNGYIEDFVTPRLLRDAQVLTVWEGTANILGMELIRLVTKFDAHILFINEMRRRLNLVPTSKWKECILNVSNRVEEDLLKFSTLSPDGQTIEAKQLMREMTLLYEGVIALEWATRHGGRYEKIMKIYMQTNWMGREIGEEKESVKHFREVI